jgi:antitoxin ParD1/3/4
MPSRNINLTDHFDEFVAAQIEPGEYRNASEVMRAALRLLEQQTLEEKQKLALLKTLADEAFREIDQGRGIELRSPREIAEFIEELGESASQANRCSQGT